MIIVVVNTPRQYNIDGRLIYEYGKNVLIDERINAVGKVVGYSPYRSVFYVHFHNYILKLIHVKSTNENSNVGDEVERLSIKESYNYLDEIINKSTSSKKLSSSNKLSSNKKLASVVNIVGKLSQPMWFLDKTPESGEANHDLDDLDETDDIIGKMIAQECMNNEPVIVDKNQSLANGSNGKQVIIDKNESLTNDELEIGPDDDQPKSDEGLAAMKMLAVQFTVPKPDKLLEGLDIFDQSGNENLLDLLDQENEVNAISENLVPDDHVLANDDGLVFDASSDV